MIQTIHFKHLVKNFFDHVKNHVNQIVFDMNLKCTDPEINGFNVLQSSVSPIFVHKINASRNHMKPYMVNCNFYLGPD